MKTFAFTAFLLFASFAGAQGTFFRVESDPAGTDWFVAPDGSRLFSVGVCHVHPHGSYSHALKYSPYKRFVEENYPSLDAWAGETAARLRDWGFTSLGAASDIALLAGRGFPHVSHSALRMGQNFATAEPERSICPSKGAPCTALPNVFHPDFPAFCDKIAAERCAAAKDDPNLIGWYIDNELAWWGQNSQRTSGATGVFDAIMEFPPEHSARIELEKWLAEFNAEAQSRRETQSGNPANTTQNTSHIGNLRDNSASLRLCVESFPVAVKVAFLRHFARTYFEITTAAIRRHDPNHLILGCRFAGLVGAHPVVWEEAGRFCDVVSFNCYPWADLDHGVVLDEKCGVPMAERFAEYHGYAKRPMIVSEWSFPALDTGRPCFKGAGQRVPTQAERAEASALFLRTMLAQPFVVGCEYFMWCDRPAQGAGKANAEDCNYGLVNEENVPYDQLLAAISPLLHDAATLRHEVAMPETQLQADNSKPSERERYFAEAAASVASNTGFVAGAPSRAVACFTRGADDSWTLSNAFVRVSGRIGSQYAADEIAFGGRAVGRIGAMLQLVENGSNVWIDAERATAVAPATDAATGIVSVTARTEAAGRFAVSLRLSLAPVARDLLAEIVSVENLGGEPIVAWLPFLRTWSLEERPVAVPMVLDRWGVPCEAQWRLPGGGVWGVESSDPSAKRFRFFVDPRGGQHPDIRFAPMAPRAPYPAADAAAQSPVLPRHPSPPIPTGSVWTPSVPTGARIYCKPAAGGAE
ncbi:MAG: hypothetical protein IKH04_13120 [Kiritimatiellae bacterium]|nr:hypothetical protein [Kiritimatiellia bacterium]